MRKISKTFIISFIILTLYSCIPHKTSTKNISFNSASPNPEILPLPSGILCTELTPSLDPSTNRQNIQACLNTSGSAILKTGTYPVDGSILIPSNSNLLGQIAPQPTWPTLRLISNNITNTLILFQGNNSRVGFLTLDGNFAYGVIANASTVIIPDNADNNFLDDNHIINGDGNNFPSGISAASVYIMCSRCKGNKIWNNQIHENFYGVIFRAESSEYENTVEQNLIFHNKCDSVSFAGYGKLINNRIYNNGWDCSNGPIPGGGVYSTFNVAGGIITGNEIYDNCGGGLDLHRVANFIIENNNVYNPGFTWDGTKNYCGGFAAGLADIRDSIIKDNWFNNNNRLNNRITSDPNGFFSANNALPLSDLPNGEKQIIAFALTWDKNPNWLTTNNILDNNNIQATCADLSSCVGLGYFVSRGTGINNYGISNNESLNYFTNNNPYGSNIGSKRCGNNWYAGDTVICGTSSPCNTDDSQHNWQQFRNDNCRDF